MPETRTNKAEKAADKSSANASASATTLEKMLAKQSGQKEPEAPTLQTMLKSFENKLSSMASQDYFDNKFKETEIVLLTRLEKVKGEIQTQIQKDIEVVHSVVGELQKKVDSIHNDQIKDRNTISDFVIKMEDLEKENVKLKKSNERLKTTLQEREIVQASHANQLNDLEQYSRRNSVIIYGIDDRNSKETPIETSTKVAGILTAKLGISVELKDIDIAHRMGRFLKDGNRPIICKFVTRFKKFEVIKSRKKLKGSPVVIKEDLTRRNIQRVQEVKEVENVTEAWFDDGKLIALLDSDDKVRVTYKTDLTKPIKPPKKEKTLTRVAAATDSIEITEYDDDVDETESELT